MRRFVVFDLETTGVDTLRDEPVQFAAQVYEVNSYKYRLVGQSEFFVIPNIEVSPKAAEVHGFSLEFLINKGLKPSEAARKWHNLIWEHYPAGLVGYNCINFDFPILTRFLANYTEGRFKFPPIVDLRDVMFLYCQRRGQRKWPKLEIAVKTLGLELPPVEELHDAKTDVKLTWLVFAELMGWTPV